MSERSQYPDDPNSEEDLSVNLADSEGAEALNFEESELFPDVSKAEEEVLGVKRGVGKFVSDVFEKRASKKRQKELDVVDNPKIIKRLRRDLDAVVKKVESEMGEYKFSEAEKEDFFASFLAEHHEEVVGLGKDYMEARKDSSYKWNELNKALRGIVEHSLRDGIENKNLERVLELYCVLPEDKFAIGDEFRREIKDLMHEKELSGVVKRQEVVTRSYDDLVRRVKEVGRMRDAVKRYLEKLPEDFSKWYRSHRYDEELEAFMLTYGDKNILKQPEDLQRKYYALDVDGQNKLYELLIYGPESCSWAAVLDAEDPSGTADLILQVKKTTDRDIPYDESYAEVFSGILNSYSSEERAAILLPVAKAMSMAGGLECSAEELGVYFKAAGVEGIGTEELSGLNHRAALACAAVDTAFQDRAEHLWTAEKVIDASENRYKSNFTGEHEYEGEAGYHQTRGFQKFAESLPDEIRAHLKAMDLEEDYKHQRRPVGFPEYYNALGNFRRLVLAVPEEHRVTVFSFLRPERSPERMGMHKIEANFTPDKVENLLEYIELAKEAEEGALDLSVREFRNLSKYFSKDRWPKVKRGIELLSQEGSKYVLGKEGADFKEYEALGELEPGSEAALIIGKFCSVSSKVLRSERDATDGLATRRADYDLYQLRRFTELLDVLRGDTDLSLEYLAMNYQIDRLAMSAIRRCLDGSIHDVDPDKYDAGVFEAAAVDFMKANHSRFEKNMEGVKTFAGLAREDKERYLSLREVFSDEEVRQIVEGAKLATMTEFAEAVPDFASRRRWPFEACLVMCERPDCLGLFYYWTPSGDALRIKKVQRGVAKALIALKDAGLNDVFGISATSDVAFWGFDTKMPAFIQESNPQELALAANNLYEKYQINSLRLAFSLLMKDDGAAKRAEMIFLTDNLAHQHRHHLDFEPEEAKEKISKVEALLGRSLEAEERANVAYLDEAAFERMSTNVDVLEAVLAKPQYRYVRVEYLALGDDVLANRFFWHFDVPAEDCSDAEKVAAYIAVAEALEKKGVEVDRRSGSNPVVKLVEIFIESPDLFGEDVLDLAVKDGKLFAWELAELKGFSEDRIAYAAALKPLVKVSHLRDLLPLVAEIVHEDSVEVLRGVSALTGATLPSSVAYEVLREHTVSLANEDPVNVEQMWEKLKEFDGKLKDDLDRAILVEQERRFAEAMPKLVEGLFREARSMSLEKRNKLQSLLVTSDETVMSNLDKLNDLYPSKMVDVFGDTAYANAVRIAQMPNFSSFLDVAMRGPNTITDLLKADEDAVKDFVNGYDEEVSARHAAMPANMKIKLVDLPRYLGHPIFPKILAFAQKCEEVFDEGIGVSVYNILLVDLDRDLVRLEAIANGCEEKLSYEMLAKIKTVLPDEDMQLLVSKLLSGKNAFSDMETAEIRAMLSNLDPWMQKQAIIGNANKFGWPILLEHIVFLDELGFSDEELKGLLLGVYKSNDETFPKAVDARIFGLAYALCEGGRIDRDKLSELVRSYISDMEVAKKEDAVKIILTLSDVHAGDAEKVREIAGMLQPFGAMSLRGILEFKSHYIGDFEKFKVVLSYASLTSVFDKVVFKKYAAILGEEGVETAKEYMEGLARKAKGLVSSELPLAHRELDEYQYLVRYAFPDGNYSNYEANLACGDALEHLKGYKFDREGYPVVLTGLLGYKIKEGREANAEVLEAYSDRLQSIRRFVASRGPDNLALQEAFNEKVDAIFERKASNAFKEIRGLTGREKMLCLFLGEAIRRKQKDASKIPDPEICDLVVEYKYAFHEDLEAYIARSADAVKTYSDDASQQYMLLSELSVIYGENVKHVLRHDIFDEFDESEQYDAIMAAFAAEMGGDTESPDLNKKQWKRIENTFNNSHIPDKGRMVVKKNKKTGEEKEVYQPGKDEVLYNQIYAIFSLNVPFESEEQKQEFQQKLKEIYSEMADDMSMAKFKELLPKFFVLRKLYTSGINTMLSDLFNYDANQIFNELGNYEENIEVEGKERSMGGAKDKEVKKSVKKRNIRCFFTKTAESANARMGAYLCIAGDGKMWKNPNYFEMVMVDEDTNKCVGTVMLLNIEAEDEDGKKKKYLWFGPNPFESFLDVVSSSKCYEFLHETVADFAEENGFDAVVVPSQESVILGQCTNRGGDFPGLIKASRVLDEHGRIKIVKFGEEHTLGGGYGYSDGAVVWEKAA